jgi:hypothetical protein
MTNTTPHMRNTHLQYSRGPGLVVCVLALQRFKLPTRCGRRRGLLPARACVWVVSKGRNRLLAQNEMTTKGRMKTTE